MGSATPQTTLWGGPRLRFEPGPSGPDPYRPPHLLHFTLRFLKKIFCSQSYILHNLWERLQYPRHLLNGHPSKG